MKQRLDEGLVFCRSEERGKCFIEYIPAELAWVPIKAEGYLYINCLWIAGAMKGHGDSNDLLAQCIQDAEAQGRKREFLADPRLLAHKGFAVADRSDCGIELLYLPLAEQAQPPQFKACAKHPQVGADGFVLYYTDQYPFTFYWVPRVQEAAKMHGVRLTVRHITDRETAQKVPAPVTTCALFRDGKFLTHSIQTDKKFLALAGIAD